MVIEALAGNGSIALAKSAAAWITGSTAIFTEAIHSPLARRRPISPLCARTSRPRAP